MSWYKILLDKVSLHHFLPQRFRGYAIPWLLKIASQFLKAKVRRSQAHRQSLHTQCHISGGGANTLDITDLHIYHGGSLGDAGNSSCSNTISIPEQGRDADF